MARALLIGLAVGIATAFATPAAFASSPTVTRAIPRGGERGTTVAVTIEGRWLHDAEALVFYRPGLTATIIGKRAERRIRARIAIAANCPPGEHAFRVRTARGLSEVRTFWVGCRAVIDEVEPNDDTPQRIRREVTVHGMLRANDRDRFAVVLRRGDRLSVEVEGLRLADTLLDPALEITGPDGRVLAHADDTALLMQDPHATIVAPRDGTYRIELVEATMAGSTTSRYRMHVGAFRRPTIAFPLGGRPGETLDVTFLGDPAGPIVGRIDLPRTPGTLHYGYRDECGRAPTPLRLRVSDLPAVRDAEPNSQLGKAQPVSVPCAIDGRLATPRDVDWFRFSAKKGQTIELRVFGRAMRSPIDPVLSVRRHKAGNVAYNDDDAGRTDSVARFRVGTDGDYCVALRDQRSRGGERFVYRLEIRVAAPRLSARWARFARSGQALQTIAVPAGSRDATRIDITRRDHNAVVRTIVRNLPAGVRAHVAEAPAGATRVPVVFEADADAPRGATLAEIATEATVGGRTIVGAFTHQAQLLVRLNNRTFWQCTLDRMPVAVTAPVRFSAKIVEPTAPLVRNGRLQLRVRVHREEGFTGNVVLSLLDRPSGVGSNSSVTVRNGKTEGVFSLSANSRAAVGAWPIVVRARATVDRATVWTATPIATLRVAPALASLSIARARLTPGETVDVSCRLTGTKGLAKPATIKLLGLPPGAAADPVVVPAGKTRAVIRVRSTKALEPGRYRTIYGQLICEHGSGQVDQRSGRLDLRVVAPRTGKGGAR